MSLTEDASHSALSAFACVATAIALFTLLLISTPAVAADQTADQTASGAATTPGGDTAVGAPFASASDSTSSVDTPDEASLPDVPDSPETPDLSDALDRLEGSLAAEPVEAADGVETSEPLDWGDRILLLSEKLKQGLAGPKEADALYHELTGVMWRDQREVYEALRKRSPDALDRRARLAEMYAARLRLLSWVSPKLRSELVDGGPHGMREVRREFEHAQLDFFFQTLAIPRGLRQIVDNLRNSPLEGLWRLVEFIFGIIVFRGWRRWAKKGLPEARRKILAVRPSTDVQLQLARLLWYLDRFRAPLEWLALLFFVSAIYESGDLGEVTTLVWVILLWTLLTRFGLLLVDALASRGAAREAGQSPGLRLKSLRLVAAWILLTGLGLDLTSRYVGEAVIHTWATRVFTLLLIPVAILLLHWWRAEIHRRVQSDATFSAMAGRVGTRKKGIAGYVNAIAGAFYILAAELLQLFIRVASRFEGGRRTVATLLRREIERDVQRTRVSGEPISQELVLNLLTADEKIIDGPYRDGIERVKALASTGGGGTVGVLAERGGGLRTFLGLLRDEIGESMRIVDCPPGGVEKFFDELRASFGLAPDADLATQLRPRMDAEGVRVLAVSNYHRVARPMRGGLVGIAKAGQLSNALGDDILWVVTLTRAAWPYISRLLGDRAIIQEMIELPAWSEAQLEELFELRCAKAGIEPDYRQLVFPRQFDDGERATLEERNRFGFRRVVWELSDGNPEVAIRLFTDSLRQMPNGRIHVRMPQVASANKIASANLATMLTLKVLVETELATVEDLRSSIRDSSETVKNALSYCIQEGWVEQVYDHYQVTWAAYRRVKRALVRRGLIAR